MPNDISLQQVAELLDEKLAPIQKTLDEHGKMLGEHGKMLGEHGKMLSEHGKMLGEHGKMLRTLKKDQDTMLNLLDGEQMSQRKRIKRIEERLEITPIVS